MILNDNISNGTILTMILNYPERVQTNLTLNLAKNCLVQFYTTSKFGFSDKFEIVQAFQIFLCECSLREY